MSPQRKAALRRIGAFLAALLPAAGWSVSKVDVRYVHAETYELVRASDSLKSLAHLQRDSIDRAETHRQLEEVILRLQQIQCGDRVRRGCR